MNEQPSSGTESPSEHLIIEIGYGYMPFFEEATPEFLEEFRRNPNMLYFGIDRDLKAHEYMERFSLPGMAASSYLGEEGIKRATVLAGDGSKLPVKDETVSAVIMRDVMGQTSIDWSLNFKADSIRARMIQSAYNALRPGGYLTIIEKSTPQDSDLENLARFAERLFQAPRELNPDISLLPRAEQVAILSNQQRQEGQYIVRFRKPLRTV